MAEYEARPAVPARTPKKGEAVGLRRIASSWGTPDVLRKICRTNRIEWDLRIAPSQLGRGWQTRLVQNPDLFDGSDRWLTQGLRRSRQIGVARQRHLLLSG